MNELASNVGSSEKVKQLEFAVQDIFLGKKIVYGKELMNLINNIVGEKLSEIIIEMLIENEVVIKSKAAASIENYLLEYNKKVAKLFFKHQILVSEILEKTYIPQEKFDSRFKLLTTFPEDNNFKNLSEIALLYPTIKRLIQEANKTLDIINPFFDIMGTKKVIPDMLTVAKKGVKIRIVTRSLFDKYDCKGNKESIKLLLDSFKKEGLLDQLEIADYFKRDKNSSKQIFAIHSKVLISDEVCYLGSANITMNSLYSNLETGVVFSGNEVTSIKQLFSLLWKASRKINKDYTF